MFKGKTMNFTELIFGKKEPEYPVYLGKIRKCYCCNGKGYMNNFGDIEDCFMCKGTGKFQEKVTDKRIISKGKKICERCKRKWSSW